MCVLSDCASRGHLCDSTAFLLHCQNMWSAIRSACCEPWLISYIYTAYILFVLTLYAYSANSVCWSCDGMWLTGWSRTNDPVAHATGNFHKVSQYVLPGRWSRQSHRNSFWVSFVHVAESLGLLCMSRASNTEQNKKTRNASHFYCTNVSLSRSLLKATWLDLTWLAWQKTAEPSV